MGSNGKNPSELIGWPVFPFVQEADIWKPKQWMRNRMQYVLIKIPEMTEQKISSLSTCEVNKLTRVASLAPCPTQYQVEKKGLWEMILTMRKIWSRHSTNTNHSNQDSCLVFALQWGREKQKRGENHVTVVKVDMNIHAKVKSWRPFKI